MRFSNSENPIIPLGILDILVGGIAFQKYLKIELFGRPNHLFHERSPKYALETNTKWMPFPNSEKPIIPLGILDILGCRNRLPKVFENCTIWTSQTHFNGTPKYALETNTKWMPFPNSENLLFR